jgi:hypothetical protein
LLAWAELIGPERTWAIESAGGLGNLLSQELVATGEHVVDVPPTLSARVRLLGSSKTTKNALSTAVAGLRDCGAQHIALPSGDAYPIGAGVDEIIAEISRFLTGDARLPAPERRLCAILFTDLVGSTQRAGAVGDAAWKRLLDHHDAVNRTAVTRRAARSSRRPATASSPSSPPRPQRSKRRRRSALSCAMTTWSPNLRRSGRAAQARQICRSALA